MENTLNTARSKVAVCNVAHIEAELRQLWRDVAQHQSEAGQVVTRVCTLTLIAYSGNQALAQRVKRAVPEMFYTHPARAVIINASGQPDQLHAAVSTVCQLAHGSSEQVCSEQITITVGEHMRSRLASTVLPLVVADLPLFVWWPGPWHPASTVRDQLFAQADRWIIDSADFHEPLPDLARMHELIRAQPTTAVTDLAWARLRPWRHLLATVFDARQFQELLKQITDVQITCGPTLTSGLLSIGWLAAMLQWESTKIIVEQQRAVCEFRSADRSISATITRSAEQHSLPQIILTSSLLPHMSVQAAEHNNGVIATTQQYDDQHVHVHALPDHDDTALLDAELRSHTHDRAYEATMKVLNQLNHLTKGAIS